MRLWLLFYICCFETAAVALVLTSRASWTDTAASVVTACGVICWGAYLGLLLRARTDRRQARGK